MGAAAAIARKTDPLRQLELLVRHKLDGLLTGDYQALVRGVGSEAGDARAYQPGEDARRIDWSLSARSGATHVRDTIADREMETWLVIDATASLDFGTARCEKRDVSLAAAAAFAFLTNAPGNRLGAVLFDGTTTRIVPPRGGRDAVLALLRQLERQPRTESGAASLGAALKRCRLMARRRGVVVVISDFIDSSAWARELGALAVRHDVVAAEISDPREDELPAVGLLTLVDPETGRRIEVQTSNRKLQQRFRAAAAERRARARQAIRAAGAAHVRLSTDREWLLDIVHFTIARRHHR